MTKLFIAGLLLITGCEVVYEEDVPGFGSGSGGTTSGTGGTSPFGSAGCALEGAMMRVDYSAHLGNDSIKCPRYVTALETWTWQDTEDFDLRISVYQESYDGFAEPACHGVRRSQPACTRHFEVICDNGDTASEDTELVGTQSIIGTFRQHDATGWSCGYDVTYTPL